MKKGGEIRPRRERALFFVFLHCPPALSTPVILPLTSSQRPFAFFTSFVVPPPHSRSLFTFFILAGIHSEMVAPPLLLNLPCSNHSPALPLRPQTLSGAPFFFPPLRQTSLSFHLTLSPQNEETLACLRRFRNNHVNETAPFCKHRARSFK